MIKIEIFSISLPIRIKEKRMSNETASILQHTSSLRYRRKQHEELY